jgi:hypothetical protein
MVMNKPVWHLIARIDLTGGSSSWHRFSIMDATINNFSQWWLLGEDNPMSWGVWEMRDITNQYILEGLRGGLLSLALFLGVLVVGFSMVGKTIKQFEHDPNRRFTSWCIGNGLFVHVVTFFGVSYFGQITMLFFLNIAIIGSLPSITAFSPQAETEMVKQ